MDLLERLLAHSRRATATLFDMCAPLTDEQFDRSLDIGHQNIHTTFGHIIGVIEFWTDSMKGTATDRSALGWSRGELRPRFDRAHDDFEQFALMFRDQNRLNETFTDAWEAPQTYGAIVLHLPLHCERHRTEILHILTRFGVEQVPEIDHALWDFVRRGLFEPAES